MGLMSNSNWPFFPASKAQDLVPEIKPLRAKELNWSNKNTKCPKDLGPSQWKGLNLYSRGRVLKIDSFEGPMILRVSKLSCQLFLKTGGHLKTCCCCHRFSYLKPVYWSITLDNCNPNLSCGRHGNDSGIQNGTTGLKMLEDFFAASSMFYL